MANATTLQLGAWNPILDTFIAHPNSPTSAIYDLNDGVAWTLVDDDQGFGTGLTLDPPSPELLKTGNSRSIGERVVRRNYSHNRTITAKLLQIPVASSAAWNANLRALFQLCEGISVAQPAALKIQLTTGSIPTYADVLSAHVSTRYKETLFAQNMNDEVIVTFECRPFLRGAKQTLSNLITNPGFEAPQGAPLNVFADSIAGITAYVGSGGALTQDVTTYSDVVMADAPLRYYRLDESAGPTVYDASLNSQNGTAFPTINFLQTGALAGSTDTAANFPASGYITVPTSGLPTGNAAFSLEGWFNTTTAATQMLVGMGANATRTGGFLYTNAAGNLVGDLFGATLTSPATYKDGAWHHAVFSWDGTNGRLYADGALVAGPTALGANTISYGAATIGAQYTTSFINLFNGTLDEVAIYSGALSAARVTAHYNAGRNTPAAAANTLKVPAGTTAAFGSPAWGAINIWQVRFRFNSGLTAFFNAHATGNNSLGAEIGAGTLYVQQTVAGTQHLLGNSGCTFINELYYWLQFTQLPTTPGAPAFVAATVFRDNGGAIGAQLAAIGPIATFDGVSAMVGQASFVASGAALGVGGPYSAVNNVWQFGPGAWTSSGGFASPFVPTGLTSMAWDQTAANNYPGGAQTSYGGARMDLPPVGTANATWESYNGGTPAGSSAIPTTTGAVMGAAAYVRSTGLSNTAALTLQVREWDASGALLRATTLQSVSGNQAAWARLSGTLTMGATTAYCSVLLQASEATSGASANGTVWWDNAQCWNITTTGQTVMPYCELRFPQSPAQLLVTGVQGDVPTPALLSVGAYFASLPQGSLLTLRVGRRAQPSMGWRAISNPTENNTTASLNSLVYGGYVGSQTAVNTGASFLTACAESDLLGVHHLLGCAACSQTTANVVKNTVRIASALLRLPSRSFLTGYATANLLAGFVTQNVYAIVDGGQYTVPYSAAGINADLTQVYDNLSLQYNDPTGSSTTFTSWMALLPIDGGYMATQFIVSSGITLATEWVWLYSDGMAIQLGQTASWRFSAESSGIPVPSHGVGGTGASTSGYVGINPAADPCITLDPTPQLNGVDGVNQLLAQWNDASANPLALAAEFQYVPLYLWPQ